MIPHQYFVVKSTPHLNTINVFLINFTPSINSTGRYPKNNDISKYPLMGKAAKVSVMWRVGRVRSRLSSS